MLYLVPLFLVALISAAVFHVRQNREYSKKWAANFNKETTDWLVQFAWVRSAQFLCAIAAGLFALLILDHLQQKQTNTILMQIQAATQAKLDVLTGNNHELQETLRQLQASALAIAQKPVPAPRTGQVAVSAQAVTNDSPVQMQVNDDVARRIETQAQAVTLQDVYNPEAGASDSQSEMDGIKKRYEGLIVNYHFLKRCGLIDARDYHTIISALAREMASVNAPGRLEHDIQTAAEGSYKEMYAQSSCDGPQIKDLQKQYSDYIKTISVEIPATPR